MRVLCCCVYIAYVTVYVVFYLQFFTLPPILIAKRLSLKTHFLSQIIIKVNKNKTPAKLNIKSSWGSEPCLCWFRWFCTPRRQGVSGDWVCWKLGTLVSLGRHGNNWNNCEYWQGPFHTILGAVFMHASELAGEEFFVVRPLSPFPWLD